MDSEEKKKILFDKINFGKGKIIDCCYKAAEGFSVEYPGLLYINIWWYGREDSDWINCYLSKENTNFVTYRSKKLTADSLRLSDIA